MAQVARVFNLIAFGSGKERGFKPDINTDTADLDVNFRNVGSTSTVMLAYQPLAFLWIVSVLILPSGKGR